MINLIFTAPLREVAHLLAPFHCAVCRNPDPHGSFGLCVECRTKFEQHPCEIEGWCEICSRVRASEFGRFCLSCQKTPLHSLKTTGLFRGILQDAIHRYKFEGRRSLSEPFSHRLAHHLKDAAEPFDGIVPVPQSRERFHERRFDPVNVLALALARRLDSKPPVWDHLLKQTSGGAHQLGRTRQERLQLGASGFSINPGRSFLRSHKMPASPRNILLLDDVCTTATTLQACGILLRELFPRAEITGLALARTPSPFCSS